MIAQCIFIVFLSVSTVTRAAAGGYLQWPDGSVTYLPDGLVMLAVLAGVAATLWLLLNQNTSSSRVAQMSLDLPEEMREPESVEYYDDMTQRTRALKRKLDADTELAESYINASRARAELEEIDEIEAESGRRRSQDINARRGKAPT